MRNAVGFYWTLPVPWAGFTRLPADIDAAAQASRTIRYQRELVRRYAARFDFRLVHEGVFLEVEPDRGSPYILAALAAVASDCRTHSADLLVVDFSEAQGWRSHPPMQDWCAAQGIGLVPVWPDEIELDGAPFDPVEHFRQWRQRQKDWSAAKLERGRHARLRAMQLRQQGLSYRSTAEILNQECFLSLTGRPWTADNLRKLLATR
ncbi:MAG: hypothetical protein AB7I59_01010 [Geminicoccaceae bacterium]